VTDGILRASLWMGGNPDIVWPGLQGVSYLWQDCLFPKHHH